MPKLACPCGFIHNLSPIPDHGWVTVRDAEYEANLQAEREASRQEGENRTLQFQGLLYECPKCGRVMWEKPGQKGFAVYSREG
jgi:hypothetical protein